MGGAARAAGVVVAAWRARPASQRKRRLKRRARASSGATLESDRHPSVALARPCKRHRRAAPPSVQGSAGLAGRVRRASMLGMSRAAKGWARPPLDEQVCREEDCRRAAGPVPQGRSAATRKEDGPAGPSMEGFTRRGATKRREPLTVQERGWPRRKALARTATKSGGHRPFDPIRFRATDEAS
jgi:hypothetical protein